VTIVICKNQRNTLFSMVSLDDSDCKSDAAEIVLRNFAPGRIHIERLEGSKAKENV
jgi:hypothetical protein